MRIILLLIFLAVSQSSCFADEYAFILKGRGNVFWKVVYDGVKETAAEKGIQSAIYNTDDDQQPEAQLNICHTALARRPKFLVLGAATKNVGIECYKKAQAEGIPFADIDGNVTVADAEAEGLHLSFSVGSNNSEIGRRAAEFSATLIKDRDKVLVIRGLPGSIVGEKRAKGFLDELKVRRPSINLVASPAGDWDRMKAMNITIDALQRDPDLALIFSVSDVMTMGVVEGLRVSGKTGIVHVVSVDGIKDAQKALVDGRMKGNVAQLPYLMGKRAVELALEAVSNPSKVNGVVEFIPTPLLTKETLETRKDPDLKYVR